MHTDVRGASRKVLRQKLRRRLHGRRAVLGTAAASVVGILVIAGVVPAIAAGLDAATPAPTAPAVVEQLPEPVESAGVDQTPAPVASPPVDVAPAEDGVPASPSDEIAESVDPEQPESDAGDDAVGSRSMADAESDGMSLLAAPTIPQGQAAITVNLRALRTASGTTTTTSPTAGVQLRLHTDVTVSSTNSYPGDPITAAWATCTTDAGGDCNFSIQGTALGKQYWVMSNGAAGSQSFLSQYLITGDNTNTGVNKFAATPYAFRTPKIVASQTAYQLPGTGVAGMPKDSRVGNPQLPLSATVATANRWTHNSGDMITTVNNPRHQSTCTPGLKVALIVDTSTSMTYNNNEGIKGAKAASVAFATQFANKDVTLGVYKFGNGADVVTAPTLVTGANLKKDFTDKINGIAVGTNDYTNWDAGIAQIKGQGYDLAVVLTDGNPTRSSQESDGGSWTNLIRLEAAILSANLVKSQGTQMLAFGVGDYIDAALPQNLEAVTGRTAWTPGGVAIGAADYAITNNWAVVSTQLASLASSLTCEATVQIHKQQRAAAGGALTDGSGWRFTPVKTGAGTLSPTDVQVTGANGLLPAPWRISFTAAGQTASVTVTETQKTGWVLESVTCLKNGVAVSGIPNDLTFTLTSLASGDNVVCTVVNAETPKGATVVVDKVWTIKDSTGAVTGTYREPAQPGDAALPQGLTATASVAGTDRVWGTVYSGFTQSQKVAISETVSIDAQKLPGCTLTSKKLTMANGKTVAGDVPSEVTLQLGANSYTLTNTVTCASTLSLVKKVSFGAAPTSSWTLTATKPVASPALQGPTGKYTSAGSVTAPVTAGIVYALAESGGPAEYVQDGAWSCAAGSAAVPVTDGKVIVPLGANVTCTVVNATAQLVLLKHVEDPSMNPGDWTLSATPAPGALTAKSALGAETASVANTFEVKPATEYVISEALTGGPGTIAYRQLAIQQLQPDGSWLEVSSDRVTLSPGATATYRFVNDKVPAVVLPLTGGTSTDAFLFGGVIALLLAGILAAWHARRIVAMRRI
ncbi:prealbumin-like fold domain-containing protein [Microbacterium terregens]|uniref:LPXTG cell wall anchor domain-containing protein n=1 Tax=Microbacterium terregens TaxID=69363 RepID=A0ABV5SX43_9MICO